MLFYFISYDIEIFFKVPKLKNFGNMGLSRVLLSCGLQESACGPHGLPTDSLFLTNMRTPIIFFPSCYKLFVCCCQTAGLLLHKSGSPQQQTNISKMIRICITLYSTLFMLIAALLLKLDMYKHTYKCIVHIK